MSPAAAVDAELVTFSIKVDGAELDSTVQVVSIDTWTAVNKVPKARLIFFDGNPSTGTFPLSAGPKFLPGAKVEVAAGYNGTNASIFKGVVVRQGLEIDQTQGSKLVLDLTHEAVKMTLERKNALFQKVKDSALISTLIRNNGLSPDVANTTVVNDEVIQYYASDWDLMLTRAELNGLVVIAGAAKVSVQPPFTKAPAVLSVAFGDDLLDLSVQMDAATQLASSAIKSYAWDPSTQKVVESGPGTVSVKEPGNVSSDQLARVFDVKKFTQQSGGTLEKGSLQDWSSAELLKARLSKIRGTARFQGNAKVEAGKTLELLGLSGRFNGTVWVSGVHQRVSGGKWLTTVEFGLSPRWFTAETPDIAAPGASGQLPPMRGLQTGVVKQVAKDPGGEFRVLVALPILQDDAKGVWARLSTFYASNKVGALFYPEVGDEVVVAFMNEDPRYPVIVGSLYSKKFAPPYAPDEKNTKKAVVTRSKLEISFDDENKIIEIKTPGKHIIKLDDKSGALSIRDPNDNQISLSKGGIAISSASNLKLTAKGNVTIDAGANLGLTAKANATMDGAQVAHKAKAKFSANGAGTAELTSTGPLTLRGLPVKIN